MGDIEGHEHWWNQTLQWEAPVGQHHEIGFFVEKLCVFCIAYPDTRYDQHAVLAQHPNEITEADINTANIFGARTPVERWHGVLGPCQELEAIGQEWGLLDDVGADELAARKDRVGAILGLVMNAGGSGIGPAAATKVLHLKRRNLIPICDSVVIGRLLPHPHPRDKVEQVLQCMNLLRMIGRGNLAILQVARERLLALGHAHTYSQITELRILDAVLWFDTPARCPHWALFDWE